MSHTGDTSHRWFTASLHATRRRMARERRRAEFFISMKTRYYNQYIENMLGNRKEEYQKDIAQIQTILCSHTEVFFYADAFHTQKIFFHTKLLHTKGFYT